MLRHVLCALSFFVLAPMHLLSQNFLLAPAEKSLARLAPIAKKISKKAWEASLDLALLKEGPSELRFQHQDLDIVFELERKGATARGGFFWSGRSELGHHLSYLVVDAWVSASLTTSRGDFRLLTLRDNQYALLLLNQMRDEVCGNTESYMPQGVDAEGKGVVEPCDDGSSIESAGDTVVIDIMLLYTPSAVGLFPGGEEPLKNEIKKFILDANLIMQSSGVHIEFNLVRVEPAPGGYDDSNDTDEDLDWLIREGDTNVDGQIRAWRNEDSIDLVGLVIGEAENADGQASLHRRDAFWARGDVAFQVTELQAAMSKYTVLHEFGHNMGLRHEDGNREASIFCYSFGHVHVDEDSGFRTVMGIGSRPHPQRIRRFSDPLGEYGETPLGLEGHNSRRALNKVAKFVSYFRPGNDNFKRRYLIEGVEGESLSSNQFATEEVSEPAHGVLDSESSVWWKWSPPVSGQYEFSVSEQGGGVSIAIYGGTSLLDLVLLVSDFNSRSPASVLLDAKEGLVYLVAVARHPEATGGEVTLRWRPVELFSDVELGNGWWYIPYMLYGIDHGVLRGHADGEFKPDLPTNRAEALKLAYEGSQREPVHLDEDPRFPDVDRDDVDHEWFWRYVFDAASRGYISSQGHVCRDGSFGFCPGDPISRYEAAKIIHALFEGPDGVDYRSLEGGGACLDGSVPGFLDVNGSDWYCSAVRWLDSTRVVWDNLCEGALDDCGEPIVSGYSVPGKGNYFGGDSLDVSGNLTAVRDINRAEMASIIAGAMNYKETGGGFLPGLEGAATSRSGKSRHKFTGVTALGKNYEQDIDPTNANAPDPFVLPGGNQQIITGSVPMSGATHDADGDELFYYWTATGGSFTTADPDNFTSVTWIPPEVATDTTFIINIINGDRRGKVGRARLELTVPAAAPGTNSPPSGTITAPNGTETSNVTVSASANDTDGLARVSVAFPGGQELELCGSDPSTFACNGTSDSPFRNNIDPSAFGASPGAVTLTLFVEDSAGNKEQVDTHTFTYDPPTPGPGFTLTIQKQGDGDGTVSGGGINCPTGCTGDTATIPEGASVSLTGSGAQWVGFAGDRCFGEASCTFTMIDNLTVRATFVQPESFQAISSLPGDGDTSGSPQENVRIIFNREIQLGPNQGAIVFQTVSGTPVPFTAAVQTAEKLLILNPTSDLEEGTAYTVSVPAGAVEDTLGELLPTPFNLGFQTSTLGDPQIFAAVYPTRVMEGKNVTVNVWFDRVQPFSRTVTLTYSPSGAFSSPPNQVVVNAGEVMALFTVQARRQHSNLSDISANIQLSEPGSGTLNLPVQIKNFNGTNGSAFKFLAGSMTRDDNSNGIFEAGEDARFKFEVHNNTDSAISNAEIDITVVNTDSSSLGAFDACSMHAIPASDTDYCEVGIRADDELPAGQYYLRLDGSSSAGAFVEYFRLNVVNNALPDYRLLRLGGSSQAVAPGEVVTRQYYAENRGSGFNVTLPEIRLLADIGGVNTVLGSSFVDVRGEVSGSETAIISFIAPGEPGTYSVLGDINPDRTVSETTFSNNTTAFTLTVVGPNRPPVLDPVGGPFAVSAGQLLSFTVTANDPDNDPLSFRLGSGAPAGASIGSSSGIFTWMPACDQVGSHPIEIIVDDNLGGSDSGLISVDVGHRADVTLTKTAGATLVLPGETISFELVVTNAGPSCVTGATVTDAMPTTFMNASWTCIASPGSTCSAGQAGDISDNDVNLLSGGTATYMVTATIADTAVGAVSNSATVTVPTGVIDPNPSDNQDFVTITLRDLDFGDAPDSTIGAPWLYPTRLADDGARHGVTPGLKLGTGVDSDLDGQPTFTSNGDDIANADDEDGVSFIDPLVPCQAVGLEVSASGSSFLDAWLDFNADGDWEDPGEQIFVSQSLVAGTNTLDVTVPCDAIVGGTYARFRVSSAGGLLPTGLAVDGEVEDLSLQIEPIVHDIVVTTSGDGSGGVVLQPGGVDCSAGCTRTFPEGTPVILTASPSLSSAFTGWGGACSGVDLCIFTLDSDLSVTATFDLVFHTLTVARDGAGDGTVSSVPAGIDCGIDCSEAYLQGTDITLTASPTEGSVFTGWSGGACSGTTSCTFSMLQAETVTATFVPARTLTIVRDGNGQGTVTSDPAGIDCGMQCAAEFADGSLMTLSAEPAADSTFEGWSDTACPGTGACALTLDAAKSVTATFNLERHLLSVSTTGAGNGVVTSTPSGIDCGTQCRAEFATGTSVTLNGTSTDGSGFAGWQDDACDGLEACTVTVDAPVDVSAAFEPSCLDTMEVDLGSWTTTAGVSDSGTSTPWSRVQTDSYSPIHSWHVVSGAQVTDQMLVSPPFAFTGHLVLRFRHRFETEIPRDGGVLEYSTDGEATWNDILEGDGAFVPADLNRFFANGYNVTLDSCCANPLGGRAAWSGLSGGWQEAAVDLADFSGQLVTFRWRLGTDVDVADLGWWIDDVEILGGGECPFDVGGARVLRVPEDHPTIQGAIDEARDGDTVLVGPGTYAENLSLTDKSITLIGSECQNAVVDGSGDVILTVDAEDVTIACLTFRNGNGFANEGAVRVLPSEANATDGKSITLRRNAFENLNGRNLYMKDRYCSGCSERLIFEENSMQIVGGKNGLTGIGLLAVHVHGAVFRDNTFMVLPGNSGSSTHMTMQESSDALVTGNVFDGANPSAVFNSAITFFTWGQRGNENITLERNVFRNISTARSSAIYIEDANSVADNRDFVVVGNTFETGSLNAVIHGTDMQRSAPDLLIDLSSNTFAGATDAQARENLVHHQCQVARDDPAYQFPGHAGLTCSTFDGAFGDDSAFNLLVIHHSDLP